jgi:transcriptional regulator with XRE-family HTH domain
MKGGFTIMKSTFQKRLTERMDELDFRQADLAEKTGLSKSRISHYINGRYEAKQEALYLIAKALDVNEAWLMGHDVPKERNITESDLSIEVRLLDQISLRFGKSAVQALSILNELNEDGQKKALSALEDLSEIPKYRKDDDS